MKAIVRALPDRRPDIAPDAFLADGAVVIGDVRVGAQSSIWYGAVLRADVGAIRIGARVNVQDLSLLHMTAGHVATELEDEVTIGHRVVLHSARVGSGALVGTGAILLDGVEVGPEALVAAGTLLTPGTVVPARTLVRGHPGRVVRDLTEEEWQQGRRIALRYLARAAEHAAVRDGEGLGVGGQPPPTK